MATATVTANFPRTAAITRKSVLARVLAALDRACASSASGVRGL